MQQEGLRSPFFTGVSRKGVCLSTGSKAHDHPADVSSDSVADFLF